ncbi:hypothetical protein A0H76_2283 [Hepatospora eriocheir]|uniref:Uncharacterized protein n=1 Tax=Hepatospora eriocheir TaxID=1081669 RepID=A0A1X0QFJ1_9MICR|nr:hypothetical protein A0H76_2283 [Hepatospora eriocheir]
MTKIKKDKDLKYFERIQRNNLIDRVKTKSIPKNKVYKTKTDKKISKQKKSVDKKKKRVAKELLTEDKKMTSKYSKLKKIVGSNKLVAKKKSK